MKTIYLASAVLSNLADDYKLLKLHDSPLETPFPGLLIGWADRHYPEHYVLLSSNDEVIPICARPGHPGADQHRQCCTHTGIFRSYLIASPTWDDIQANTLQLDKQWRTARMRCYLQDQLTRVLAAAEIIGKAGETI